LVVSKHGIYDLYVLRVLTKQCPEQVECALYLIGNLLRGSSRVELDRELLGLQEYFYVEVFSSLTLRVGHRVDLAQTLNYLISKIIHITFGLALLNSGELQLMLDCLSDKSACVFLYDHELEDIATLVERPLLIEFFQH
jgi:hypothetical protein